MGGPAELRVSNLERKRRATLCEPTNLSADNLPLSKPTALVVVSSFDGNQGHLAVTDFFDQGHDQDAPTVAV
jgi:hypothetical protein